MPWRWAGLEAGAKESRYQHEVMLPGQSIPHLTGQVDLVEQVIGLRDIIKGHSKHWLLGRVEGPIFLGLTPDEHAGQVDSTPTNHKLHTHNNIKVCFTERRRAHLEEEVGEEAPE